MYEFYLKDSLKQNNKMFHCGSRPTLPSQRYLFLNYIVWGGNKTGTFGQKWGRKLVHLDILHFLTRKWIKF